MDDHESLRLLVAEPDECSAVLSAVFSWKLKTFGLVRMRRQEARKDEANISALSLGVRTAANLWMAPL